MGMWCVVRGVVRVVSGVQHLDVCLLQAGVGGVALLPQKFTRAQEGRGVLELPPDHIVPLVELQRQVAMRSNPVGESCGAGGHGSICGDLMLVASTNRVVDE